MNYRILSGAHATAGATDGSTPPFLERPGLRVEGSGWVASDLRDGATLLFLGNALGWRTDRGLLPVEDLPRELRQRAAEAPLDTVAEAIEGSALLVRVDADGGAEVRGDRYGRIEMFYRTDGGGMAAASDLDLLGGSPHADGYDQAALAHMLTYYGHCPPKGHTIYRAVRRLRVGETVRLRGSEVAFEQAPFSPVATGDYEVADHDRYRDAFLDHLRAAGSEKGNLVYLSSGWDSTGILAGLVHVFGASKVRGVIGRMRYSDRSGVCNRFEMARARAFADHYGVSLDVVDFDITGADGADFFRSYAPFMRAHQLYSFNILSHGRLTEYAAEHVDHGEAVFAGEISDGAHNLGFSQYATWFHPSFGFREYADKMAGYQFGPTYMTRLMAGEIDTDPVHMLFRARAANVAFDPVDPESVPLQLLTSFFLRNGRMPFWSLSNSRIVTPEGAEAYTSAMQDAYLRDMAPHLTPETIYSVLLHLYNSFHWQGATVRTLPTLSRRAGLRLDLPFWDQGIQDFLSAMPESWGRGLDLNNTKFPLKRMLEHELDYPMHLQAGPHSYTYDVDHAFNHYEEAFSFSGLRPAFEAALEGRPYRQVLSEEYFALEYIDGLADRYLAGANLEVPEIADLAPIAVFCLGGWYGKP